MPLKNYEDMNLMELDVMREISSIGMGHAATSLSGLLGRQIRISVPEVNILSYEDALSRMGGPEKLMAATLVKLDKEIKGLMLFIYDLPFAGKVLEDLLGKPCSSFEEIDKLGFSALEEVGNIIICSYINAFIKLTGAEIGLSVPGSTVNMLGGILTVPMVECGLDSDKLMYVNAGFVADGIELSEWMLMLPEVESLNVIMEKLGIKEAGA